MTIEVLKVELKSVSDASGLEKGITSGLFKADEVIGVIGKTEGNGGVNDFTRILADQAFRRVLLRHGKRDEKAVNQIPMVWSGGCDGVITPHATVFARNDKTGPASKARLVMGTAISAVLLPEDIGRPAMVEKVAAAVKDAMRDAGISDPKDVHYVQTKTPLLTIDSVRDAESRGQHVAGEVHDSMGVSNGTTALGIAVALGEIKMPKAEQVCKDLDLYSSVASCSSGVELTQAQIVLLGNRPGAGGRYRIGHAVMRDALDIDGIYDAIRNAGLNLPDRPRAEDLHGRVVNCFMKCEADRRGTLRGRRQIMLDDSDVHHHRHSKAAVGGVAAAAIGDPAVFVSVDAMHQGPQGGGPVIAIVEVGVFPVSSSLPYFVALERGFFKEQNIEPEMVRLIGGPPNIAAMITNQIDAAAVLVTIEGMNADLKKPGVAMYISLNSQNKTYQMEQFVVRKGYPASSLKDLKGAKIMSAPGPANVTMAKAALAAAGLKEGDYTIDQLDMAQHVNVMQAGTFDAGYTLEPNASTMRKMGIASTIEAGVIAHYVLGDPNANAFVGGGALTSDFIKSRPDVAKRFTAAWGKAVAFINSNPQEARKHLLKNTFTPEDVVDTVPMIRYYMVGDLTAKDKADFQKFIDFSVQTGTLPEKVDVTKYMQTF